MRKLLLVCTWIIIISSIIAIIGIWTAFNIKVIRTKVCKEDFTPYLEEFMPKADINEEHSENN